MMDMTGQEFLRLLESKREEFWDSFQEKSASTYFGRGETRRNVITKEDMLYHMCRTCWAELRQADVVARWMLTTPELDVKLDLCRQCGDEGKHFAVLSRRLRELGIDIFEYTPLVEWAELFDWFEQLPTTVERMAGCQITAEHFGGSAQKKLSEVVENMDPETSRVYQDYINTDESYHVELGRNALEKYATSPEKQDLALKAFYEGLERQSRVAAAFNKRRQELIEMGWPAGWWRIVGKRDQALPRYVSGE